MGDYYAVLEITHNATAEQIRQAYKRLALKWHPDKHLEQKDLAEKKFKELGEAYGVLSDPQNRKKYDKQSNETSEPIPNKKKKKGEKPPQCQSTKRSTSSEFNFNDLDEFLQNFFKNDSFDDMFGDGPTVHNTPEMKNDPRQGPKRDDMFAGPFFEYGVPKFFKDDFRDTFGIPMNCENGSYTRETTTTMFVNGKTIVKKSVLENGVQTTKVYENGILKRDTSPEFN